MNEPHTTPDPAASGCAYGRCGLLPGGVGVCLCKFLVSEPAPPDRVAEDDRTRSVDALKRRLAEAADTMALTQRHLDAARKRRDLLCLKLRTAGCSTREIGAVAGLSSPGVLLATDRAAADMGETP